MRPLSYICRRPMPNYTAIQITNDIFDPFATGENVQNGDHSEAHLSTFSQSSKEVSTSDLILRSKITSSTRTLTSSKLGGKRLASRVATSTRQPVLNNIIMHWANLIWFTNRSATDILTANFYYGSRMSPRTDPPRKTRRRRRVCAHHRFWKRRRRRRRPRPKLTISVIRRSSNLDQPPTISGNREK